MSIDRAAQRTLPRAMHVKDGYTNLQDVIWRSMLSNRSLSALLTSAGLVLAEQLWLWCANGSSGSFSFAGVRRWRALCMRPADMLSPCGELPFLYPQDPGDAGACGLNMTAMGVPAVGLVTGQVKSQAHSPEGSLRPVSTSLRYVETYRSSLPF